MKIDRDAQRQLLEKLTAIYPDSLDEDDISAFFEDAEQAVANCFYLHEHGLIEGEFGDYFGGGKQLQCARATHRGADFTVDDGGLSALLGVVTVRYHEDTLRQLIAVNVAKAEVHPEERSRLLEAVKSAPSDSIRHLTARLVDQGMDNLPRLIELLRTSLF